MHAKLHFWVYIADIYIEKTYTCIFRVKFFGTNNAKNITTTTIKLVLCDPFNASSPHSQENLFKKWDKDDDYDEWLVLGNIEIITILTLWWYYLVVLCVF